MEAITLEPGNNGREAFYLSIDGERLGEMEIATKDGNLTVYHTEVSPKAEGKGLAKKLLTAMVDHARSKELKVVPLCPYVLLQFKRRPEEYKDVWVG